MLSGIGCLEKVTSKALRGILVIWGLDDAGQGKGLIQFTADYFMQQNSCRHQEMWVLNGNGYLLIKSCTLFWTVSRNALTGLSDLHLYERSKWVINRTYDGIFGIIIGRLVRLLLPSIQMGR